MTKKHLEALLAIERENNALYRETIVSLERIITAMGTFIEHQHAIFRAHGIERTPRGEPSA